MTERTRSEVFTIDLREATTQEDVHHLLQMAYLPWRITVEDEEGRFATGLTMEILPHGLNEPTMEHRVKVTVHLGPKTNQASNTEKEK